MNADKTQLVWLGTRQQLNKLTTTDLSLSYTGVKLSSSVLDLGVHVQSADHGRPRCRSTPVMSVPTMSTANDQVVADLGSSKNTGACIRQQQTWLLQQSIVWSQRSLLEKLQTDRNAAARFITGTRKFDHITPVLHGLHCLPVRQCITFKLHSLAPSYLADVCTPVSSIGRWQLPSANSLTLVVPGTRTTIHQRPA